MENEDLLDKSRDELDKRSDEADFIKIEELLEFANSKVFDSDEDLLEKNRNFEKVSSFFDLVKSESNVQPELNYDKTSPVEKDEMDLNEDPSNFEELSQEEQDSLSVEDETDGFDQNNHSSHVIEQDESSSTDIEVDAIPTESEDDFEPLDVIEKSRETSEKLAQIEEKNGSTEEIDSNQKSVDYERGYTDALKEFETTIEAEKLALSKLSNTLFSVRNDASTLLEELIKEKIKEVTSDFLGKTISEFPNDFLTHIENVGASIVAGSEDILVEFNEIDAAALKLGADLDNFPFRIREVSNLGRGEFRMIAGKSGYEQKLSD